MAVLKKSSSAKSDPAKGDIAKSDFAYESVPFRRTLTMIRNDSFKIYLGFDSAGYCYIVQENDEGRLPLVYKKSVLQGDRLTLPEDVLPEKSGEIRDFRARELSGTNRFYIIVSAQPRQNLERLMEQQEQDPAEASLERSILSEVLAIRRSVSSHSGSSAESDHMGEGRRGSRPADPQSARSEQGSAGPEVSVPPTEADPAMKGQLWLFEGREAWVITVTVRVQ